MQHVKTHMQIIYFYTQKESTHAEIKAFEHQHSIHIGILKLAEIT